MLSRLPLPAQIDRTITTGGALAGLVAAPYLIVVAVLFAIGQLSGPEFVFWLDAGVIVAAALGAVLLRHIVHAALCLVVASLGVAGIFLLLASEFLALVQVLVYGGGVTILLLFGLMMTNAQDDPIVTDGAQKPFAFGAGIALGGLLTGAMLDANWGTLDSTIVGFRDLGARLYRDYGIPFEIASLVLLVALVGAVAIARRDPPTDEEDTA
jgi:NADH-quinone oxidoreductase subunit J